MIRRIIIVTAALITVHVAAAREYFASPNGTSSGIGSRSKTWDLSTALTGGNGAIAAGDTLSLLGGTYVGLFNCTLRGARGNPILIRSAPGEWARIDGYKTTTLASPLTATSRTIVLANAGGFSSYSFAHIGTIDEASAAGVEDVRLDDKTGNTFSNCQRGWNGTQPRDFPAGSTVMLMLDGVITVTGSDLIFRDLEVMNSFPMRVFRYYVFGSGRGIGARPEGFTIRGARVHVVNCIIHDNGDGIGFWQQAVDSEISGCILFNNGHSDSLRGHGHGLYIQNQSSTKRITDVISFNNFAMGMKAFGEAGPAIGVRFSGVIAFNNGSASAFVSNPSRFNASHRYCGLFVGTSQVPADDIVVDSCCLVHPPGVVSEYGAAAFGYTQSNETLRVTNNYIASSQSPLALKGWRRVTARNNRIVAVQGSSLELVKVENVPAVFRYDWDENEYIDGTPIRNCYGGNRRVPFYFPTVYSSCNRSNGGPLSFAEWKTGTGFDTNATYSETSAPATHIFIRQNRHEAGRAHVAVMNWVNAASVKIDPASFGLRVGDRYQLIDVQNIERPLFTRVNDGSAIELPMNLTEVLSPIGATFTLQHTAPTIAVFLLRRIPVTTAIESETRPPNEFVLQQNFPNPFSDRTTIQFQITDDGLQTAEIRNPQSVISFKVLDIFGREVLDLGRETVDHSPLIIENSQLPRPGVYFYQLRTATQTMTKSMILLE